MTQTLIHDLLIILAAGLVAGLVCRWWRVSILIGYLLAGATLGRGGLGWVLDENHQLEQFAEAGVFLLLFSIGLEFSLDDLKRLGWRLLVGGTTQMTLVAAPAALAMRWLGLGWQPALLIAAAVAFSSTVLVFKALSEWGQTQTPHGRRAVGILLFQDAALVPLLLCVPLLTGEGDVGVADYARLAAVTFCFLLAVFGLRKALARFLIPRFAGFRSPELVILFTIVSLGGVTLAAHSVALPPAVGAFAAGLIFNGNRWTQQIDALVLPFRETFAAVFFVGLGLIANPRLIWTEPVFIVTAITAIVAVKTLAAAIALRLTGLAWRPAIGTGLGLAHIGEFAFVLVLLGLESGVLQETTYQRLVAVAVGSLVLTPMLMKTGLQWCRGDGSSVDEQGKNPSASRRTVHETARAVVIGAGPIGRRISSQLETMGRDVCLVDLSPVNLQAFAQAGFRVIAGDASDDQILSLAGADQSGVIVVCVPADDTAVAVVTAITRLNPNAYVLVRCRYQSNVTRLTRAGADDVVTEESEATLGLLKRLADIPS